MRASIVGGTAARCEAPPAAAAHTAEVRLSHDGGASWSAPLRFTYVSGAPPALHRARPSALAAAAAAGAPRTIALVGENFVVGGSGARCAFGSAEVAATVDSATGARCAAPVGGFVEVIDGAGARVRFAAPRPPEDYSYDGSGDSALAVRWGGFAEPCAGVRNLAIELRDAAGAVL